MVSKQVQKVKSERELTPANCANRMEGRCYAVVPHSAFNSLSEMLALQFDVVLADSAGVERLLVEG